MFSIKRKAVSFLLLLLPPRSSSLAVKIFAKFKNRRVEIDNSDQNQRSEIRKNSNVTPSGWENLQNVYQDIDFFLRQCLRELNTKSKYNE